MKHFLLLLRNKMVVPSVTIGLMTIGILVLLYVPLSWATHLGLFGPPSDFMNSNLAVRTDTGTSNLSIRLIEFLMGIPTDKFWEEKNDAFWILKTGFTDPVTEEHRTYLLEFEKTDNLIVLSCVFIDNRKLSNQEMMNFALQIRENFGKHVGPK